MRDHAPAGTIERATIEDLQAIVVAIDDFWGERDMAFLHQSLYVHEFGDTALVSRAREGTGRASAQGDHEPRQRRIHGLSP
jgi:hypothetical protein